MFSSLEKNWNWYQIHLQKKIPKHCLYVQIQVLSQNYLSISTQDQRILHIEAYVAQQLLSMEMDKVNKFQFQDGAFLRFTSRQ